MPGWAETSPLAGKLPPFIHANQAPMPPSFADVSYNPWVVAISLLIATFASYVALDLAKRVRTTDRVIARAWLATCKATADTATAATHDSAVTT